MGKLVNVNQSTFIPGRNISDNIMVTKELMRGYNRKYGVERCAMKIDLQKDYDTINWGFIEKILGVFGLHDTMVQWIMKCIAVSVFSVNVNGELHGFFHGARGLRQGDPISPYIFTLVMEVFTLMMQRRVEGNNIFKYHWGCKKVKLTHLCFADDLLVVCNGDINSVKVIKEALDEFSGVSGLVPNVGKSTSFFGSVDQVTQKQIIEMVGFQVGKLPVRC